MATNDWPLVSIVIPTYNRFDKLETLINSILNSSYKNIEVIVVDDHSSDLTVEKIEKVFKKKIKVVVNYRNSGVAKSRNRGIEVSQGEIVFLIDDDNILHPHCIERITQALTSQSSAIMAGPTMYYARKPEKLWWAGTKRNMLTSKTKFVKNIPEHLSFWNTDDFPNAWAFKAKYKYLTFFDEKLYMHYEESDFAYRLKKSTSMDFIVVKDAVIYHDISEDDSDLAIRWNNSARVYYTARNRKIFHKRYSGYFPYIIFLLLFNNLFTLYYIHFIWHINMGSKKNNIKQITSYLNGAFSWGIK